jgi:multicomponent Na+:H+ antiporter subunit F
VTDVLKTISSIVLGGLAIGILLCLVRIVRGPTLPDRVVALDVAMYCAIGVIVTYAIRTEQQVLLDVAIVLALIGFLGTIAFAWYLEKWT